MASKAQLAQTVSSKGQIVIPAELRKELGIEPGTRVHFERQGNALLLQPITKEFIRSLRGFFGKGPSAGDYWEKEHRKKDWR